MAAICPRWGCLKSAAVGIGGSSKKPVFRSSINKRQKLEIPSAVAFWDLLRRAVT